MRLNRVIALFFLTLLLSCNHVDNFKQLSNMQRYLKTKGGYDSYLALEYLEFSRNYYLSKDRKNGEYFAKKGLNIVQGKVVAPESPVNWKADKVQIEEMLLMQKRLEMVLNEPQIKVYIPIQLAHLTYLYDCWIARESKEIFRASDLAYCKTRFYKLLDEIETYVENSKKDIEPQVVIKTPEFKRFEVLFDSNSFEINDEASKNIIEVLKYTTSLDDIYRVLIVGNNDANEKLSDKNLSFNRAQIVKEYLVKNGILENVIEIKSIGEDFPDIINQDGELKQANRRVGIYILKGVGSVLEYSMPLIQNKVYQSEIKEVRKKRGLKK